MRKSRFKRSCNRKAHTDTDLAPPHRPHKQAARFLELLGLNACSYLPTCLGEAKAHLNHTGSVHSNPCQHCCSVVHSRASGRAGSVQHGAESVFAHYAPLQMSGRALCESVGRRRSDRVLQQNGIALGLLLPTSFGQVTADLRQANHEDCLRCHWAVTCSSMEAYPPPTTAARFLLAACLYARAVVGQCASKWALCCDLLGRGGCGGLLHCNFFSRISPRI